VQLQTVGMLCSVEPQSCPTAAGRHQLASCFTTIGVSVSVFDVGIGIWYFCRYFYVRSVFGIGILKYRDIGVGIRYFAIIYEGRSINKLQNSVILLFFRNIRFVGNLSLSTSCKFYHYDVTVTQVINNNYGNIAVKVVP